MAPAPKRHGGPYRPEAIHLAARKACEGPGKGQEGALSPPDRESVAAEERDLSRADISAVEFTTHHQVTGVCFIVEVVGEAT